MSQVVVKSGEVPRYNARERVIHWFVAILFILLTLSGLALFHPAFFPLAAVLGGGVWAAFLHPFLGVLMFAFFLYMTVRYWRANIIRPYDREWGKRILDVINNRDENLPESDKYNLGQKLLFWTIVVTMTLLLVSGIILWRPWPYFAEFFPLPVIRVAAVVHMLSGFVLILGIIVHIYAVIWVPGSLRAMTRGTVSHAWAKHHCPRWYRRVTGVE